MIFVGLSDGSDGSDQSVCRNCWIVSLTAQPWRSSYACGKCVARAGEFLGSQQNIRPITSSIPSMKTRSLVNLTLAVITMCATFAVDLRADAAKPAPGATEAVEPANEKYQVLGDLTGKVFQVKEVTFKDAAGKRLKTLLIKKE
jgi:hypothetical protein